MTKAGGKRPGAGRKKGFAALESEKARLMIAEKLAKQFAPIVDKAIEDAKRGDATARAWLTDRAYGKPNQAVDHTTLGKELPTPIYGGFSKYDSD